MTAPATSATSTSSAQRPLRLLTLVSKAPGISPGQRFRLEQWAPHLARDHGIVLEFEPFESPELTEVLYQPGQVGRKARLVLRDGLRRWTRRHEAEAFDGVVIFREASLVGGAWLERWLARRGIPFVLDFDDAIWLSGRDGANGLMSLARMPWKTAELCRMASAVTVGNNYLANYARQFNPKASNVSIVPTSIDLDRFPLFTPPPNNAPFTIVWTGSHSTLVHLELARPAIETLAERMPVRVRVICDLAPPPFNRAQLEFVPWSAASEAADLAYGHVGIMPLPDTPSARGKCGCKALQYMAIGRPAIVSPVAINREIVRDGENGLHATTQADWVAQLDRLAKDPALRARLGKAGRQTVETGYSATVAATAFSLAVRRAIGAAEPVKR